eukprot:TRINITY_DN3702_c0_g2_i1.p1 TRINITY_DN3702_c0_g2~~TRINITY_DN3702_c0_g2_i1.p1  ORF type:complete len:110 (-),score=40.22 TRINITY_DN3702_c0_g2_i1:102-431(-)
MKSSNTTIFCLILIGYNSPIFSSKNKEFCSSFFSFKEISPSPSPAISIPSPPSSFTSFLSLSSFSFLLPSLKLIKFASHSLLKFKKIFLQFFYWLCTPFHPLFINFISQ